MKRPSGPAGIGTVQQFAETCGASRFATAHAEGGLKISAERPEISARLFDASSQAQTSLGRKRDRRTMYSTAVRSFALPRTVTLPRSSIM